MITEEALDAIAARLKVRTADLRLDVEHFPDNPDNYPFASRAMTLLVAPEVTQYAPPSSINGLAQEGTSTVSVTSLVRGLRGTDGATGVLTKVRRALHGWEPTKIEGAEPEVVSTYLGWTRMMLVDERFVSQENGVWRFVSRFSTKATAVAEEEERTGAPFTEASFRDVPCGQDTTPPEPEDP